MDWPYRPDENQTIGPADEIGCNSRPREVKFGNYILNFFLFFLLHSTILSACQYVGSTDPTVLPIRKVPLALMYDPLDNHEIAFGVVHFALRFFP